MDWFSWLSKTSLDPFLVYEYALAFTQNELEKDDIFYFNHDFLQSMGISIAKHRLEILKLATKQKESAPHLMSRLLTAIKPKTSKFSTNFRSWACRDESALVIIPSLRYKNAKAEKSKRPIVPNKISKAPLWSPMEDAPRSCVVRSWKSLWTMLCKILKGMVRNWVKIMMIIGLVLLKRSSGIQCFKTWNQLEIIY